MKNIAKLLHYVNVICMHQEDVNKSPVNSDEIKLLVSVAGEHEDNTYWLAEVVNSTPQDDMDVPVYWSTGSRAKKHNGLDASGATMEEALANLDAQLGAYMLEIGI